MVFLKEVFDFILPRFCAACKKKLETTEVVVCYKCLKEIKKVSVEQLVLAFGNKFRDSAIITDFHSLYLFEKDKPIQGLIHELKYRQKFLIGKYIGKNLGRSIKRKSENWQLDLIMPVPLHHLKLAERGFNQSLYIAKGLESELKIKVENRAIKRKRYTQSQTTMDFEEREKNIKDAFSLKSIEKIRNKNILLIDDVITTGATIRECGKLLLDNGANKIYAASAALAY